jgi:hypothetical protein
MVTQITTVQQIIIGLQTTDTEQDRSVLTMTAADRLNNSTLKTPAPLYLSDPSFSQGGESSTNSQQFSAEQTKSGHVPTKSSIS